MTKQENIVEKLSLFNNLSFTKKQWEVIFKGCNCPKSTHFWAALRDRNMTKEQNLYTLIDIDLKSFNIVWDNYCTKNRSHVRKNYKNKMAIKHVQERKARMTGITLFMVNGVLTTEIPTRE